MGRRAVRPAAGGRLQHDRSRSAAHGLEGACQASRCSSSTPGTTSPRRVATRDEVARRLPLTVVDVTPRRTVPEQDAEFGDRMHSWDPVQCCEMRKVAPLKQALTRYEAWATGLRREDAPTRRETSTGPLGRQERPGEGEPARRLDPAGPRGVRLGQRRAAEPASVAGLPVDRLRAVHPAGRQRRGRPRRAAGSASTRTSAGSTSDERLPAAARPRRPPGRRRGRRPGGRPPGRRAGRRRRPRHRRRAVGLRGR